VDYAGELGITGFYYTCGFTAPELVLRESDQAWFSADVFSLACILYLLATRHRFYETVDHVRVPSFDHVDNGVIRDEHMVSILRRMTERNARHRSSIDEVLHSPYFVDNESDSDRDSAARSTRSRSENSVAARNLDDDLPI
jgi:serine/threonine protein kinase